MGLFSGLASIVTAPLSIASDVFLDFDSPVDSIKNRAEEIDYNFKK